MGKVKTGQKIPHFRLLNQDGELVDIASCIGKPIVIFFYPKDDTPGCTKEVCTFRDGFERFSHAGVHVFGISADSVESHKSFRLKNHLPYDLLSDENNKVRNLFGVPADLFGFIPGRVTYVVDNEGIVRHIINNQLNPVKHVEESLREIEKFSQLKND